MLLLTTQVLFAGSIPAFSVLPMPHGRHYFSIIGFIFLRNTVGKEYQ